MAELAEHQYGEATKLFQRELVASEEAEEGGVDQRGIANCTQGLGRIARLQGRFDEARVFYQRSLTIRQQLKNADGSEDVAAPKSSYHDLGLLAHQQGEWEQIHRHNSQKARELYAEALSYYEESLRLKKLIGNKSSIAHTLTELAELARLRASNEDSTQEKALNVQGIVLALWRGFYRWWLGAFIGLSIIRLLIVIVMHRGATRI